MRFPYQLCGYAAAAVFLLCAAPAPAATIILPAAKYNVSVGTGSCDGFNCSKSYSKSLNSTGPAGLQVACSADAGAPNCAEALLLAAPAPFLSVGATTSLNHQSQSSTGLQCQTNDKNVSPSPADYLAAGAANRKGGF
jgi:hypothetical protein